MKMIRPFVLAIPLCAVCAGGGCAHAGALILVQDGAPMAVIGIHTEASVIEREAADDLQTHLRMASGAAIDIVCPVAYHLAGAAQHPHSVWEMLAR